MSPAVRDLLSLDWQVFEITPGASPGDSSEASIGNIRLLLLPGKAFFPRLPGICVTQLSIGVHEFDIAPVGSQETFMCHSFPPTLVVPIGPESGLASLHLQSWQPRLILVLDTCQCKPQLQGTWPSPIADSMKPLPSLGLRWRENIPTLPLQKSGTENTVSQKRNPHQYSDLQQLDLLIPSWWVRNLVIRHDFEISAGRSVPLLPVLPRTLSWTFL